MEFGQGRTLGPFKVDQNGRLHPNEHGSNPTFGFSWRNRAVHAVLKGDSLALQAMIGRVPSTGGIAGEEPAKIEDRERVFSLLRGLQKLLPPLWRLRLLADHRVRVEAEEPLEWPTTATGLMTSVTQFVLVLAPYLDLLDETGVAAMASGGRLKI
jgi:hypothetical protein